MGLACMYMYMYMAGELLQEGLISYCSPFMANFVSVHVVITVLCQRGTSFRLYIDG